MSRSSLILHSCCGVCSIYVIEQLKQLFEVTVYFYNPNIQPEDEYKKRRDSVKEICLRQGVIFKEADYQPVDWFVFLKQRCRFDFSQEPEGGQRCLECFRMRLEATARLAKEENFEYFATTLTMGRNKKAEIINTLGRELAGKWGVKFYEADWKKKNGLLIAYQKAKEQNIYRQNYCGCLFSKNKKQMRTN
jgi:predicted adenine nucleotide alpha hydrolase (AANH) superfamily ATPase